MAAMDALWHRAANGRPYALVLLDARMPDADGLAVAAMIRERAELAATRIILLTSGSDPATQPDFANFASTPSCSSRSSRTSYSKRSTE